MVTLKDGIELDLLKHVLGLAQLKQLLCLLTVRNGEVREQVVELRVGKEEEFCRVIDSRIEVKRAKLVQGVKVGDSASMRAHCDGR